MGTPEFATYILNALIEAEFDVCAVITAPDKPSGRGQSVSQSAVKIAATSHNIPVLQPEKLRDPQFLAELGSFHADLFIVVAFRMLPEQVWGMLGENRCINLHASLLPAYRGAAPINWALINGEIKTGVTTFFIEKEIDTGKTILQKEIAIPENWNAGDLHDALARLGAETVVETVRLFEENKIAPIAQNWSENSPKAPKIFPADCEINYVMTARQGYNFIRALAPYPAAWTLLHGKNCKILRARLPKDGEELSNLSHLVNIGDAATQNGEISVKFADGILFITELKLEGRKQTTTRDFLNGYREKIERLGG